MINTLIAFFFASLFLFYFYFLSREKNIHIFITGISELLLNYFSFSRKLLNLRIYCINWLRVMPKTQNCVFRLIDFLWFQLFSFTTLSNPSESRKNSERGFHLTRSIALPCTTENKSQPRGKKSGEEISRARGFRVAMRGVAVCGERRFCGTCIWP